MIVNVDCNDSMERYIKKYPYGLGQSMQQQTFNFPINQSQLDKDILKEVNTQAGNEVLRNIEAQETHKIGELSLLIHEKISALKAQIPLTNNQWKQFAELTAYIIDLIGDPCDTKSSDSK